jgi:arachidonate 5-lipoxygenase
LFIVVIAVVVLVMVLVNGSALVARRAACRWAEREIGSSLATAVVGWPYLCRVGQSLRGLVPEPTRPRSTARLLVGVTGLRFSMVVIGLVFATQSRKIRGRATHTLGLAVSGSATVPTEGRFPPNAFFRPGRRFDVTLRHATNFRLDDAALDGRGAGIRLYDGSDKVEFMFNTGRPLFWNTKSFFRFLIRFANEADKAPSRAFKRWIQGSQRVHDHWLTAAFRAPTSFAHLTYNGQPTFRFAEDSGREHLVRYRLRGLEDASTGANDLDIIDLKAPRNALRRPEEKRPDDYSRREYRSRIERGPVAYVLEAQFVTLTASCEESVFDGARPWDARMHPWLELARIEVDTLWTLARKTLSDSISGTRQSRSATSCLGGPANPTSYRGIDR